MSSPSQNQSEGERLRDGGMSRAAARRPDLVTLGRLAMLEALLKSVNNAGTIDDATSDSDVGSAFGDGGQWRGTVTRSLAKAGYIQRIGYRNSRRPSRHCGTIAIWQLTDPAASRRYVERLRAALECQTKNDPAAATAESQRSETNHHEEENRNGSAH